MNHLISAGFTGHLPKINGQNQVNNISARTAVPKVRRKVPKPKPAAPVRTVTLLQAAEFLVALIGGLDWRILEEMCALWTGEEPNSTLTGATSSKRKAAAKRGSRAAKTKGGRK